MRLQVKVQARFFAFPSAVEPLVLETKEYDYDDMVYKTTLMQATAFRELRWLMLLFCISPKEYAKLMTRDNPMLLKKQEKDIVKSAIK